MREDKDQLTNDPRVECFDREAGWYEGWRPTPHPTVDGYDSDDPKAWALDRDFNPDLARDIARGK